MARLFVAEETALGRKVVVKVLPPEWAGIREFKTIVDNRGWEPVSPLYPLAHVGLARAYAMVGDKTRGRESYEAFFKLWANADANIPMLVEARRDYEALR